MSTVVGRERVDHFMGYTSKPHHHFSLHQGHLRGPDLSGWPEMACWALTQTGRHHCTGQTYLSRVWLKKLEVWFLLFMGKNYSMCHGRMLLEVVSFYFIFMGFVDRLIPIWFLEHYLSCDKFQTVWGSLWIFDFTLVSLSHKNNYQSCTISAITWDLIKIKIITYYIQTKCTIFEKVPQCHESLFFF